MATVNRAKGHVRGDAYGGYAALTLELTRKTALISLHCDALTNAVIDEVLTAVGVSHAIFISSCTVDETGLPGKFYPGSHQGISVRFVNVDKIKFLDVGFPLAKYTGQDAKWYSKALTDQPILVSSSAQGRRMHSQEELPSSTRSGQGFVSFLDDAAYCSFLMSLPKQICSSDILTKPMKERKTRTPPTPSPFEDFETPLDPLEECKEPHFESSNAPVAGRTALVSACETRSDSCISSNAGKPTYEEIVSRTHETPSEEVAASASGKLEPPRTDTDLGSKTGPIGFEMECKVAEFPSLCDTLRDMGCFFKVQVRTKFKITGVCTDRLPSGAFPRKAVALNSWSSDRPVVCPKSCGKHDCKFSRIAPYSQELGPSGIYEGNLFSSLPCSASRNEETRHLDDYENYQFALSNFALRKASPTPSPPILATLIVTGNENMPEGYVSGGFRSTLGIRLGMTIYKYISSDVSNVLQVAGTLDTSHLEQHWRKHPYYLHAEAKIVSGRIFYRFFTNAFDFCVNPGASYLKANGPEPGSHPVGESVGNESGGSSTHFPVSFKNQIPFSSQPRNMHCFRGHPRLGVKQTISGAHAKLVEYPIAVRVVFDSDVSKLPDSVSIDPVLKIGSFRKVLPYCKLPRSFKFVVPVAKGVARFIKAGQVIHVDRNKNAPEGKFAGRDIADVSLFDCSNPSKITATFSIPDNLMKPHEYLLISPSLETQRKARSAGKKVFVTATEMRFTSGCDLFQSAMRYGVLKVGSQRWRLKFGDTTMNGMKFSVNEEGLKIDGNFAADGWLNQEFPYTQDPSSGVTINASFVMNGFVGNSSYCILSKGRTPGPGISGSAHVTDRSLTIVNGRGVPVTYEMGEGFTATDTNSSPIAAFQGVLKSCVHPRVGIGCDLTDLVSLVTFLRDVNPNEGEISFSARMPLPRDLEFARGEISPGASTGVLCRGFISGEFASRHTANDPLQALATAKGRMIDPATEGPTSKLSNLPPSYQEELKQLFYKIGYEMDIFDPVKVANTTFENLWDFLSNKLTRQAASASTKAGGTDARSNLDGSYSREAMPINYYSFLVKSQTKSKDLTDWLHMVASGDFSGADDFFAKICTKVGQSVNAPHSAYSTLHASTSFVVDYLLSICTYPEFVFTSVGGRDVETSLVHWLRTVSKRDSNFGCNDVSGMDSTYTVIVRDSLSGIFDRVAVNATAAAFKTCAAKVVPLLTRCISDWRFYGLIGDLRLKGRAKNLMASGCLFTLPINSLVCPLIVTLSHASLAPKGRGWLPFRARDLDIKNRVTSERSVLHFPLFGLNNAVNTSIMQGDDVAYTTPMVPNDYMKRLLGLSVKLENKIPSVGSFCGYLFSSSPAGAHVAPNLMKNGFKAVLRPMPYIRREYLLNLQAHQEGYRVIYPDDQLAMALCVKLNSAFHSLSEEFCAMIYRGVAAYLHLPAEEVYALTTTYLSATNYGHELAKMGGDVLREVKSYRFNPNQQQPTLNELSPFF